MKITLWLAAVFFVLFCGFNISAISGEIDRKTEIETVVKEVKAECYELAGLCQQYLGICMETLHIYEKYQKEIGVSADEIRELKKAVACLPDKIEFFLNKPDLLDGEIRSIDFNNTEECRYVLGILNEMFFALKDSVIKFKAQIIIKKDALKSLNRRIGGCPNK